MSVNWKFVSESASWWQMRRRCLDPNHKSYKNYGGRGISICPEWLNFKRFLADMGPKPKGTTLDRIDNDGDYRPGNCRWASKTEQNRNSRKAKLNTEAVKVIRSMYGRVPCSTLAALHRVQRQTITHVVNGSRWANQCDRLRWKP